MSNQGLEDLRFLEKRFRGILDLIPSLENVLNLNEHVSELEKHKTSLSRSIEELMEEKEHLLEERKDFLAWRNSIIESLEKEKEEIKKRAIEEAEVKVSKMLQVERDLKQKLENDILRLKDSVAARTATKEKLDKEITEKEIALVNLRTQINEIKKGLNNVSN